MAAFAAKRADVSIAVSAYTAQLIAAAGASPASAGLIPAGVDLSPTVDLRAGSEPLPPTFVTVARLEDRYKGHDVLSAALPLIRAEVPDVRWIVIGDGPLRSELEERVRSSGVGDSVHFLGPLSDEERDVWLRRTDLLAMPSRLPEDGTPGRALESSTWKPVRTASRSWPGTSLARSMQLRMARAGCSSTRQTQAPSLARSSGCCSIASSRIASETRSEEGATFCLAGDRGATRSRATRAAWGWRASRRTPPTEAWSARAETRVRALYVNHTAEISGAERSLLSLLGGLPDTVEPLVATPHGQLFAAVQRLGIPVTPITGTAGSLRLHPLHTPWTLGEMSIAARQVGNAVRRYRADVVHANSIRAGVVLALWLASGGDEIVHVRDCLPRQLAATASLRLIAARATMLIANSGYTARSVEALAPRARFEVVHNPVDLEQWNPARIDRAKARARLGEAGRRRVLCGVVAQLSPWKGQDTAIEALRLLCAEGVDAHLILIGSPKFVAKATRFDNRAYLARLRAIVADAGLEERVSWLGERDDVPELVRALDVLLLPSIEEPFGRAVIEAMALEVPVIATDVGGPPEIISDGYEGYLLPPHHPDAWARAIRFLAEDPERARLMGCAGRKRVEEAFTVDHHVAAICDTYARVISRRAGALP